jgi:hypothetical protein
MRPKQISLLVAALVAGACATALGAQPTERGDAFLLRVDGNALAAVMRGDPSAGSLYGPGVQLEWGGEKLQGRALGAVVSLQLQQSGEIRGYFGSSAARLTVWQDGDAITVRGLFDGRRSDLRVDPAKLEGTIGRCSYQLTALNGAYQGWRSCGNRGQQSISLQIGPDLAELPPVQFFAYVGPLLARR